jgi:hypothetical protein
LPLVFSDVKQVHDSLAPKERNVYSARLFTKSSSLRRCENVYSAKLSIESSSLRRSEMFIVPGSLQNLPRSGGGKSLLRLSHPHLAPLGAECVNPHGKYVLTDLNPNRFRSERSAFPHTTRLQRGSVQVHYRDCAKQGTETNFNQRHVRPLTYPNRSQTSHAFG